MNFGSSRTRKLKAATRIDLLYRLNGGGRPHITFNRGGVLFGFYFATQGVELQAVTNYDAFEAEWYYFVGSQSKQTTWMYINGELDARSRMLVGMHVWISVPKVCASLRVKATAISSMVSIDEFKMWSVALTEEEVVAHMEAALAVDATGKTDNNLGKLKTAAK